MRSILFLLFLFELPVFSDQLHSINCKKIDLPIELDRDLYLTFVNYAGYPLTPIICIDKLNGTIPTELQNPLHRNSEQDILVEKSPSSNDLDGYCEYSFLNKIVHFTWDRDSFNLKSNFCLRSNDRFLIANVYLNLIRNVTVVYELFFD